MESYKDIQAAIKKLPGEERGKLRRWLLASDTREWDRQISRDAGTGKLDAFAAEALAEHKKGKTRSL